MRKFPQLVAGVDGCRTGWVVALGEVLLAGIRVRSVEVVPQFSDILEMGCCAVAVDMPIGLPERAEPGGRSADRAARAMIGPRRSSVFSPPIRAVLGCNDYSSGLSIMRASSEHGLGLTKQCWNIVPKIREIDVIVHAHHRDSVFECHPEISFTAMAGQPMAHPKVTPDGALERQAILLRAGITPLITPLRGAKIDDILDAQACMWTAGRIALGEHRSIPVIPEFDSTGLPMRIVY